MSQLSIIFPDTEVTCNLYPDWMIFTFQSQVDENAIIVLGGTGIAYVPLKSLSIVNQEVKS